MSFQGALKDRACPFAHPEDITRKPKDTSTVDQGDQMAVDNDAAEDGTSLVPNACPPLLKPQCEVRDKEFIPKTQGRIWHAEGDGSCLYYSVLYNNDPAAAKALRRDLANYMEQQWKALIPGLTREVTVEGLVSEKGFGKGRVLAVSEAWCLWR